MTPKEFSCDSQLNWQIWLTYSKNFSWYFWYWGGRGVLHRVLREITTKSQKNESLQWIESERSLTNLGWAVPKLGHFKYMLKSKYYPKLSPQEKFDKFDIINYSCMNVPKIHQILKSLIISSPPPVKAPGQNIPAYQGQFNVLNAAFLQLAKRGVCTKLDYTRHLPHTALLGVYRVLKNMKNNYRAFSPTHLLAFCHIIWHIGGYGILGV